MDSNINLQFLLDIGVVDNPADAGFYSGLAESVLAIAQLLTGEGQNPLPYHETIDRQPLFP